MNFCCLRRYPTYSISFNSSTIDNYSLELNSNGLYQSSGKEKESCCLVFPSLTNHEIGHFHVLKLCSDDSKEMYKKAWCTFKVVVWPISTNFFLPFLLTLPSLLLKLPNEKFTVKYRLMNKRIIMSPWVIKMKLQKGRTQLQYNVHCNSV